MSFSLKTFFEGGYGVGLVEKEKGLKFIILPRHFKCFAMRSYNKLNKNKKAISW